MPKRPGWLTTRPSFFVVEAIEKKRQPVIFAIRAGHEQPRPVWRVCIVLTPGAERMLLSAICATVQVHLVKRGEVIERRVHAAAGHDEAALAAG